MHSRKHIDSTSRGATAATRRDASRGRRALHLLALALPLAALALALQGCQRGADSGATANPNAPGRPGTGNATVELAPRPESLPESPQVGGARHMVPEGITGRGGPTDYPGAWQSNAAPSVLQQPGVGLDGGLDGTPLPGRSGSVAGEVDPGTTGS